MTVDEIIEIAEREIGTTEYPPNSNKVKYNTWFYGREVSGASYPWCAAFISWLFRSEPSLLKKSASCASILSDCITKKMIVSAPMKGDIVFFKFGNTSKTTNHIGIVADVQANKIITIEGNTSFDDKGSQANGGAVARRVRTSSIVAFARPKYNKATNTMSDTLKTPEEVATEVIDGKWGVGVDRRLRLVAAGYNYKEIQSLVNEMLKG